MSIRHVKVESIIFWYTEGFEYRRCWMGYRIDYDVFLWNTIYFLLNFHFVQLKNYVCFFVPSQIITTHFQTYSSFFSPWWTSCYRWSCRMWATLMWLPSSGYCACSELSEHSEHCVFWELSGKGRVGSGLTRWGRAGCLCRGAELLLLKWFFVL